MMPLPGQAYRASLAGRVAALDAGAVRAWAAFAEPVVVGESGGHGRRAEGGWGLLESVSSAVPCWTVRVCCREVGSA
jgi:hypothetical protein